MVLLGKSVCSDSERISGEKPPSEKKSYLATSKTLLSFDMEPYIVYETILVSAQSKNFHVIVLHEHESLSNLRN